MKILILSHGLMFGGAQIALFNYLTLLKNIVQLTVIMCDNANKAFVRDIQSLGIDIFKVNCELVNDLPIMHIDKQLVKDTDLIWISDIEYLSVIGLRSITQKPIVAHLHSYALVCPWWALSYGMREVCTSNCRDNLSRFLLCKIGRNRIRASVEMYNYGLREMVGTMIKGPVDFYRYKHFYYDKIIQAINSIDGFIAVSNAVRELYILHEPLFKDKPINVIYNPVVIPNKHIEYSLSMNLQQNNILYASGFQAAKGIHVLLRAFNYVLESYPDAKLVITRGLGDSGLIKLMNKFNVNRNSIALLGHLNRYELFKTYAESSVVTVPSIWPEPLPNVAVESNMLGVPVVASKIGGLSEVVIDGETGYLIKPGEPEELAEALIKALSINWDRRKINVLTSNRFDPASSIKHILRFFSSFL